MIRRDRTAMHRGALSRPVRQAVDDGLLADGARLFDYGCGRGGDVRQLRQQGIAAEGWDPAFAPGEPLREAEVVNLGYVVNVIEDRAERAQALTAAWSLATRVLVVSARTSFDSHPLPGVPWADGVRTSRKTFQRLYTQEELRDWIEVTLGIDAVAAAPGVFYVFRDQHDAQALLARGFRRRVTVPRTERLRAQYEHHREALEALVTFMEDRGRPPRLDEPGPAALVAAAVGSVQRAVRIITEASPHASWEAVTRARAQDLLVYLALARFGGRQRLSELPVATRHDIKAFFGSYADACRQADRLLFAAGRPAAVEWACRASTVGKVTPSALYVHTTALGAVPAVLRVFEGCARVLTGAVPDATLIKLHRREPVVSYLSYPGFDRDPHPALAWSLVADLTARRIHWRSYAASANPPVLHRKESFVAEDYPRRALFARLTSAEDRAGLFANTDRIGTRDGWGAALTAAGRELRGHRLVRTRAD
ncbi:MAG TPA: DNA phosphorothioation-associated putative methyltransferase [Frankiaceae bacterium]|nr:DNA phosphorothioation-associated putative methyltransferase [Frankiaceae bacterium]